MNRVRRWPIHMRQHHAASCHTACVEPTLTARRAPQCHRSTSETLRIEQCGLEAARAWEGRGVEARLLAHRWGASIWGDGKNHLGINSGNGCTMKACRQNVSAER